MKPSDATRTVPCLGIDLGGTKIEIVALDGDGRELLRRRVATPRGDYGATLESIVRLVAEAESALGVPGQSSIGIGTPGTHSRATGLMRNCNSVWLNGRPLGGDLVARLERPVTIANDANCFALSEATDGAGRGAATVFGVILGTGVGGGLVVHGRVLEGPNGIAGECLAADCRIWSGCSSGFRWVGASGCSPIAWTPASSGTRTAIRAAFAGQRGWAAASTKNRAPHADRAGDGSR